MALYRHSKNDGPLDVSNERTPDRISRSPSRPYSGFPPGPRPSTVSKPWKFDLTVASGLLARHPVTDVTIRRIKQPMLYSTGIRSRAA
jgi:hypothetical protein